MQSNLKKYLNIIIKFLKKYYYFIIPIILLIIFGITIIIGFNQIDNKKESKIKVKTNNTKIVEKDNEILKDKKDEKETEKEVVNYKVDIKGAVNKPGVYEVIEGSRVIDVINTSGGLKENANTFYINLSKKVTDEMVIIIYTNEEIENLKSKNKEEIDTNIYICPDNINDACIASKDESTLSQNEVDNIDKSDSTSSEKIIVNINSATKEQLMTLPGLGETKASAIITYREENGNFTKLEDLTNVTGIGTSTFEKLKKYITI